MSTKMSKTDHAYGSIEEQKLTFDGESSPPVQQHNATPKEYSLKTAAAIFVLFAGFSLSISRTNVASNVSLLSSTAQGSDVALPDYVTALDETDPEWDASRLKRVIGDPGKGKLIPDEVALVRFTKPHFVFRTYGGEGKANQCGYWWTLNPPQDDKDTYFDHFAICPEWNDASDIIRCRVPVGYVAVVGVGQTVSRMYLRSCWSFLLSYVSVLFQCSTFYLLIPSDRSIVPRAAVTLHRSLRIFS